MLHLLYLQAQCFPTCLFMPKPRNIKITANRFFTPWFILAADMKYLIVILWPRFGGISQIVYVMCWAHHSWCYFILVSMRMTKDTNV